jgi:hypothetical protein
MPLFTYTSQSQGSTTQSISILNLFGNPFGGLVNLQNTPRLGFDYAITNAFTVGGSAFVGTMLSNNISFSGTSNPGAKLTAVGIEARGGFLYPIADKVDFWPRAGFSFVDAITSPASGTSSSVTQWAATVEALLLVTPLPHVSVEFGAATDIPLSGSSSQGSTSTSTSQFQIGLTAGIEIFF